MAKLYELSEQYRKFNEYVDNALNEEDLIEDDLQMFIDTLDSIEDSIGDKVENIAKFLKNIEGDIKAYKAEEERLSKKRKYLQNKFDGLKKYTQDMLELAKIDKVKAGLFNVRLQKNPPSAEVINAALVPDKYKIPQDPKIDGKAILEALEKGEKIDGAKLVDDKKHIRIS